MLIPKVYATAFVVDNSRKSYIHNICTSQHMLSVHMLDYISYDLRTYPTIATCALPSKVKKMLSGDRSESRSTYEPGDSSRSPGTYQPVLWLIFGHFCLFFFFISLGEKMRSKQSNFFLRYYLLFCIYYLSIYKYKCLSVFFLILFSKSDLRKNLKREK